MSTRYHYEGKVVRVEQWPDGWRVAIRTRTGLLHTHWPLFSTEELAQAKLDAWAEKKGLEPVNDH